jgi:mannitol/fructose-specific phosphotransferase system IIA component (Ntr-type)
MMMMFLLIEQSHGIYLDCQARCMSASRRERNRDTLKMCRDECELIELLEQEDARDGKHYRYRQYN